MTPREFYGNYSTQEECTNLLYKKYKAKMKCCPKCNSVRMKWYVKKTCWRCMKCKRKISLKSISFMRDSKISFKCWVEVMYLLLETKKSFSICEIQRLTSMNRYATVYYMVQKIRKELGIINRSNKMSKRALVFFDFNSPSSGSELPTYLQITYGKNKFDYDFIHLDIPGYLKNKCKKLCFEKSNEKGYPFKKVIHYFDSSDTRKNLEAYCMNRKWSQCVAENLLKEIKGIYHNISLQHLQKVIDEYCFKYNYRHNYKSKFLLFVQKLKT